MSHFINQFGGMTTCEHMNEIYSYDHLLVAEVEDIFILQLWVDWENDGKNLPYATLEAWVFINNEWERLFVERYEEPFDEVWRIACHTGEQMLSLTNN